MKWRSADPARPASKKAAPVATVRSQSRVVKLAARPARTPEQEIPLDDTGTFGKF